MEEVFEDKNNPWTEGWIIHGIEPMEETLRIYGPNVDDVPLKS